MGAHPEKILVVPTSTLAKFGVGEGFSRNVSVLDLLFRSGDAQFRVRDDCEHDPAWKQIIPYVVLACYNPEPTTGESADHIFSYTRSRTGDEGRLYDLFAVGVGGHVEQSDMLHSISLVTYEGALRRELDEEVTNTERLTAPIIGIINDNSNDVGRHHLGIVHKMNCPTMDVAARENHLADAEWRPRIVVAADVSRYESWSQLVITEYLATL